MGLGRGEFLRLCGLALAGIAIDPLKAVAVNRNYYINKKLGVICEKPDAWDFVSVNDYGRLLDEQIFPNEVQVRKKEVFEEIGYSAVIMTKYGLDLPGYDGHFSPTIMVDAIHKSDLDFEYESFKAYIEDTASGTALLLKEFRQISLEGPILLSGYTTYTARATYLFEHVDLKAPLTTNLRVLFIEHNNFYYIFNMHDTDEFNEQHTFDQFIKTIKLI